MDPLIFDCSDSVKRMLNDSIEQLNFIDEPAQCAKRINQFVEQATKDNIKIFISKDNGYANRNVFVG